MEEEHSVVHGEGNPAHISRPIQTDKNVEDKRQDVILEDIKSYIGKDNLQAEESRMTDMKLQDVEILPEPAKTTSLKGLQIPKQLTKPNPKWEELVTEIENSRKKWPFIATEKN